MTRILSATAILICLAFSSSNLAYAQESRSLATDNGCFPWQDFKNGQCVAKPSQSPPPALPEPAQSPPPAVAPPAPPPLTAAPAPPVSLLRPEPAIVCDGGTVTDGACACPQGFNLVPAAAGGGTCARANADNCLGGELTTSGKCICNGQVTMDGETYLLEYSNGKCLPMRCPVTALHDGKCGAATTSAQPSAEPERKGQPSKEVRETRETSDEDEHRRHCGRGMVMTRSGCVAAHRRQDWEGTARQYYRNYYQGPVTPQF
jgi:hypothetical protein